MTDTLRSPLRRTICILVVDDHELIRLGVRALLQSQALPAGVAVDLLEASSLAEALAMYECRRQAVDLVLLDLALPDAQGLSGVAQWLARYPAARIAVITGLCPAPLTQQGLQRSALDMGAVAFLPKAACLDELVGLLEQTCRWHGEGGPARAPLRPAGMGGNGGRAAFAPGGSGHPALRTLPARHVHVLQLVLEGKTNREIAQAIHLSEGTVKNYVSTLLLRFGVRSRAQLITALR
ncbi:response regulator transcription factor [Paracidovorax wautersii]|uniref:DNA-binding response regulator, NarL/FixJ family, contains REC and HTH domains n=1 Tax=Paracidovorax wautersii TaxID=1177982 RepID=A0A1I2BWK3_9BURK|nr:response regulator transcription factor [Paracidovorax wautersii]SFE60395.1 DNA-binding response regulator, NarL/FixJ family, contains REC and HTH domains [Paracidovorax wautersii]